MNITQAIKLLRDYYVDHGLASDYQAINNGLCVGFAESVEEELPYAIEIISNDWFMIREDHDGWNGDNEDVWCETSLEEYGAILPEIINCENLTDKIKGYHCWIYYNGKHYDAECPNGVVNLFELPFFQRHLSKVVS